MPVRQLVLVFLASLLATSALAQRRPAPPPAAVQRLIGQLRCEMPNGAVVPLPHVTVRFGRFTATADANGRVDRAVNLASPPGTLEVCYDSTVPNPGGPAVAGLTIMGDVHETLDEWRNPAWLTRGTTASFGVQTLDSTDCALWVDGVTVLQEYLQLVGSAPPVGEFRIKRWSAIYVDVGMPHAYYDYVVVQTDYYAMWTLNTLRHEFGHTVRHAADGDKTHWDGDMMAFMYARMHVGNEITMKQYALNEGWAQYWEARAQGLGATNKPTGMPGPAYMDWNENLVGDRLLALDAAASAPLMHSVLENNPGVHTLFEFEQAYCAAVINNPHCAGGLPTRAAPNDCPPEYFDDGLTCRLDNIRPKPSQGRGVGVPPTSCGPGKEYDAGLCYPWCPAGFDGVGPVCWQQCPAGYTDDGAFCRRDAHIFSSNTSACPWYDACGLFEDCSVCPAGYINDGCTCRRNPHIFAKDTVTRGVGTVPNDCGPGKELDAGLCYPLCPAGMSGVGPVCWGSCDPGFDDHGATCYRAPHVFQQHGSDG